MRLIVFLVRVITSWKFVALLVVLYFLLAWMYLKDTPAQVTGLNLGVIATIPLVLISLIWGVKKLSQKTPEDDEHEEKPALIKPTKKKVEPSKWLYVVSNTMVTGVSEDTETVLSALSEGMSPQLDDGLSHPIFMSPVLSLRADIDDSRYVNSDNESLGDESAEDGDDGLAVEHTALSERIQRIMAMTETALDNIQTDLLMLVGLLPSQKKRMAMEQVDPALLHHEWLDERLNVSDSKLHDERANYVSILNEIHVVHMVPQDVESTSKTWLEQEVVGYFTGLGCEPSQVNYVQEDIHDADSALSVIVENMAALNQAQKPTLYIFLGADSHLDQLWLDSHMTDTELGVGELGGALVLANHAFASVVSTDSTDQQTMPHELETKITVPVVTRRAAKLQESMRVDSYALVEALKKTEGKYRADLPYGSKASRDKNQDEAASAELSENTQSGNEKPNKIVYYLSDINKAKQPAHISEFQSFREHVFQDDGLSDLEVSQWVTCGELGESSQILSPFITLVLAADCPRDAKYTKVFCHSGALCRSAFVLCHNESRDTTESS